MLRPRAVAVALSTLALAAVACTPAATSSASAPAGGDGGTTVNVSIKEFEVAPDVTSAPAGTITFHVTNDGPDDLHEFVVIKTDLAPNALPTVEDGSVAEEGEGMEVIGEVEDIPVGESQDVDLTLEAGAYALICNIVEDEDGVTEAHYAMGMRTGFTVE
jgi:plastocyanin